MILRIAWIALVVVFVAGLITMRYNYKDKWK